MTRLQEPLRGQCLCGAVRYEASGAAGEMWYCHCRACRKSSGVGFGTWVEAPGIRWLAGEQQVTRVGASPALVRAFCAGCGPVLPAIATDGGKALLPAGGLDNLGARRPGWHAFVAERAPWLPAWNDLLPQYPGPRGQGDPIDPQSDDALQDATSHPRDGSRELSVRRSPVGCRAAAVRDACLSLLALSPEFGQQLLCGSGLRW